MPALNIQKTDGFAVFQDSKTSKYHITPENNLHDVLYVFDKQEDTKPALDAVLNHFYDIAETFCQHLSEGCDKVTDLDIVQMTDLINRLTYMRYSDDNMPHYQTVENKEYKITIADFAAGNECLIIEKDTGIASIGSIIASVVKSQDPDNYNNEFYMIQDHYDLEIKFETDEDEYKTFIALKQTLSEE